MGDGVDNTEELAAIISGYVGQTGGLISALHAAQARYGFLPPQTDAVAAHAFNLTRAEVKGVISFYADFRREPAGRTTLRLCAAEACQAQGGRALERAVCRHFAIEPGSTSASGDLTLNHVYCLGLCTAGPAAMIDDRLVGRATPEKIAALVEERMKAHP